MRRLPVRIIAGFCLIWACPILKAEPTKTTLPANTDAPNIALEIIETSPQPVLDSLSRGAEDIKYGIEGGSVVRSADGSYHLFTAERFSDPIIVKMRLAHWSSRDGKSWNRIATLYESSGEFTGADPKAALWAPMPIFDEREDRWSLFYVAYRCKPNTPEAWYENYEGRIWRAESVIAGRAGLGGPYRNVGVVMEPDAGSQRWEGLQGVDSFFPFKSGEHWMAFYGSAKTESVPCTFWGTGLASAPALAGPWQRLPQGNPVRMDAHFAENPIVTKIDETWVALIDGGPRNMFGYATSPDGLHWSQAAFIDLTQAIRPWWTTMRTPLCLLPEADGSLTLFFTALASRVEGQNYGCLGRVRLQLKKAPVRNTLLP